MSTDLIKRAAERLERERELSLIERAAGKQPLPPVQRPLSDAEPTGAFGSQPAPQAASPPPAHGSAVPAPEASAGQVHHTARMITIDQGRLRLAGMVTPSSDTTRIAEEFRIIKRPLLMKAFGDQEQRVHNGHLVMVTSARPNEGKTFFALNLAMSLASERDLNVLLIDADFKNPSLPKRLGFTAEKGLIDILADGQRDMSNVLIRTDVKNLSILPAGVGRADATEILASQQMVDFVEDIAKRYSDRVIIFDTPPVLASSEPSVLAMHVGQCVFVVEAEATSRRAIQEALTLISSCPNVSLVLNKNRIMFKSEQFGSYYGYGSVSGKT